VIKRVQDKGSSASPSTAKGSVVSTGVAGLDNILCGGLPAHRMYLIQGDPGVGKTTVALQFLREGVRSGERVLYVTLSETREELAAVAESHGWTLEGVDVYEMSSADGGLESGEDENTLYVPAEIELGERMRALLVEVDRVKPARLVIDSCTELRLLAHSALRFRRQLLALKEGLVRRGCTILLLANLLSTDSDPLLQSLVHGVILMEQLPQLYGAERRRVRVVKLREVGFRGGFHDMNILADGVVVFPRLVAAEHRGPMQSESISSGLPSIDALLGGGLDRGTSNLFMGPAGSGKSALTSQYAATAAERGERVAMFTFDEGTHTLLQRANALGMHFEKHLQSGLITVQQVDPAELSPGEFIHIVRKAVEDDSARMVIIDSLNGYLQSMPEERFLVAQMHELLAYLAQRGVVTIMVVSQQGLVGSVTAPVDISYLADTVVLTRYFEVDGHVRKAVSVMKKRSGRHENTIREMSMGTHGISVGEPLSRFRGLLSGITTFDDRDPAQRTEKSGEKSSDEP
jgi:circadian clock protein KaiC